MMHSLDFLDKIVFGAWFVFVLYWLVSATDVKKDVESKLGRGRSSSLVRIVVAAALTYLFPTIVARLLGRSISSPEDSGLRYSGTILTMAGISFAIWARYHLGRNWSGHPALKEDHKLVSTGPYSFLRHPIYAGMLFACLGSLFATFEAFWLYFLLIMGIVYVRRIHIEEGIMMRTFPDAYPAYREKTNALIPFIW